MKRKISDCFYYYNGYCYKGNNCPFRHEPRALGSSRVCKRWKMHLCNKPHCPHRHSNFRLRRLASPRFWEDRSGQSPFLKSRYFISQGCDGDNEPPHRPKWSRKVFLAGDEQKQKWTGFNPFLPRLCDRREWNEQPESRYSARENIRVLLERVQDPESPFGRIFLGNYLTDNENSLCNSLNAKNESFQTTPETTVFKTEPTDESEIKPKIISSNVSDAVCTCSMITNSGLFQVINRGLVEPMLTDTGSGARNDRKNSNENVCNEPKSLIPVVTCSNNKMIETSCDRFKSVSVELDKRTEVFSSSVNATNTHRSFLQEVPSASTGGNNCQSLEESSKNNQIFKEVYFNKISNHTMKSVDFPDSKTTVKPREAEIPSNLESMLTQMSSTSNSQKSPTPYVSDSRRSCGPHTETSSVGYYTRLRARIKAESEKPVK